MRTSNEMQLGKAGEYLVCADLILKGFVAFPSEQGLPYDVVLDNGKKIIRVQVKTTKGPRIIPQRATETNAYIFNIKRCGKGNKQRYGLNEVDVFALVCLDTMDIGYIKSESMPDTINLRVDSLRGSYYDEKGIADYLKVIELHKTIKSQTEISKLLGIHVATVNRMVADGFKPFKTNATYFSDIIRDKEWFECL